MKRIIFFLSLILIFSFYGSVNSEEYEHDLLDQDEIIEQEGTIPDEITEIKEKTDGGKKKKTFGMDFETSFGYSLIEGTALIFEGQNYGTYFENFGYVPTFGFALQFNINEWGLKIGSFYQKSSPSIFGIDETSSHFFVLNYTLYEIYLKIFRKVCISKDFYFVLHFGFNYFIFDSIDFKNFPSIFMLFKGDIYFLSFSGIKHCIFAIQSVYRLSKYLELSIIYSISPALVKSDRIFDLRMKHTLSIGLSHKLF